jgi:hypothetical protein
MASSPWEGSHRPEAVHLCGLLQHHGAEVNRTIRTRPKIIGHARFNGAGASTPPIPRA